MRVIVIWVSPAAIKVLLPFGRRSPADSYRPSRGRSSAASGRARYTRRA